MRSEITITYHRASARTARSVRQPTRAAPRTMRQPARMAPQRVAPRRQAAPQRAPPQAAALAPRPAPAARTPAYRTIAPKYLPTTVDYEFDYDSEDEPGTIVIDTEEKFLYLIQKEGKARRYGIAVGREGFGWSGTVRVGRKAKWPTWTPPREMIKRQPWLAKYARGMPGGPSNPLGGPGALSL
jgi:lipoprotein-anchoring transpeptidase ErfK/SrfK